MPVAFQGYRLSRSVKSPDWSFKKQIVGCSIHAITLQFKAIGCDTLRKEGPLSRQASNLCLRWCSVMLCLRSLEKKVWTWMAWRPQCYSRPDRIQTDRVTASHELAKKVTSFVLSLQPQTTPSTGNSEVNLLKQRIELLQQQLIGFQQPAPSVLLSKTVDPPAPAATPPPSQATVTLPTVHDPSTESSTNDRATTVKGSDGSTKLQKQVPKEGELSLFHAFQKAVPPRMPTRKPRGSLSGKTGMV